MTQVQLIKLTPIKVLQEKTVLNTTDINRQKRHCYDSYRRSDYFFLILHLLKLCLMPTGFKLHRKVLRLNTASLPWSPLSAAWVPSANLPASGHLPMESLNLRMSAGGISQQLPHLSPHGRDRGIWIKITNEYGIHMPLVRAPELRVAQMQPK